MKRLLPMLGHTRGNRSPVTCELKCGSAHPAPNTSATESFRDIVSGGFSRRAALGAGAGVTGALVVGGWAQPAAADFGNPPNGGGKLPFTAITPTARTVDTVTVPEGYRWDPRARW